MKVTLEFPSDSKEKMMRAVRLDGTALLYIPYHLQTKEIITEAILNDGNAVDYAYQQLLTEELKVLGKLNRNLRK